MREAYLINWLAPIFARKPEKCLIKINGCKLYMNMGKHTKIQTCRKCLCEFGDKLMKNDEVE